MWNRSALLLMAGAALLAMEASSAVAQDTSTTRTTTSSQRIKLTKESTGEVVSRVDTVTVYHTDTLNMPATVRVDTVTVNNTVTRVDTVNLTPLAPRRIGGLYLGLGAGVGVPYGAIRSVNQTGPLGQVQLGYQKPTSALGVRGDVNYTHYAHDARYAFLGDRPNMWNANLDLTLHLPFFNHTLGSSVLMTPYLIGGGSWVSFSNLRMKLDGDAGVFGGVPPQDAVIAGSGDSYTTTPNGDTGYHSNFGWNAGGGLAFHAGRKDMFVEARAVRFDHGSQYAGAAYHWPIVFGVNFY